MMTYPHPHHHQTVILKYKILISDEDDDLDVKPCATTNFTEDQTEHITPMHAFHDNIGDTNQEPEQKPPVEITESFLMDSKKEQK